MENCMVKQILIMKKRRDLGTSEIIKFKKYP